MLHELNLQFLIKGNNMKIGIIREGKIPPDTRVPLTPLQCKNLMQEYSGLEIAVQSSGDRCFTDEEYREMGIPVLEEMGDYDILFGVKEVPVEQLIPGKTYFFFSHTIKKQAYNRHLLRSILEKKIRLIDYECLRDSNGERIIAFGRWAGIVGAHNGLMARGKRTGAYHFPRVYKTRNYAELKAIYNHYTLPPVKIAVTGGGRVSSGVVEVLEYLRIHPVSPGQFLEEEFPYPVFTQLHSSDLYEKADGSFRLKEFYENPADYRCKFRPFTRAADMLINGMYWDPRAPVLFTREEMLEPGFRIRTIADITCDINGSVPATIRPSTIEDPVYGYNPVTGEEETPYSDHVVDVMAVDNLPNELPRDASEDFGSMLTGQVIPELMKSKSEILERASIAAEGRLTSYFSYLEDYVAGRE